MEWLMGFGSRQLVKNRNSTNYDSDAFSWCYCLITTVGDILLSVCEHCTNG
jgi:hypothetical protein